MGITDAAHDEYAHAAGQDPTGTSVVSLLACSLAGTTVTLKLMDNTRLAGMHAGVEPVVEQTTCNYGLDPKVQQIANGNGMAVSAIDDTGEVRAIERTDHPYFFATLYQPQLTTSAASPHPLLTGLVAAALAN